MEGPLTNKHEDPAQENLTPEENAESTKDASEEKKPSRHGGSSFLGKAAIGLAAMLGMAESVDGAGHNWHYGNGQNYSTPNNSQNYNYRGRQMPPNTAQYPVQGQGMNQNPYNHNEMVDWYIDASGHKVFTPGHYHRRGEAVHPQGQQSQYPYNNPQQQGQHQGAPQLGYTLPNSGTVYGHERILPGESRYDPNHAMNQQEVQHQKTLVALSGTWTLGTMTTEELHASAQPLAIGDIAKEMVRDISASGTEYNVSVHQISVAHLGLQDGATYDQILTAATAQGYSVCPPEVALQVALQTEHALPNEEAIFVGMLPLGVGNSGEFIFAPEHGQDGNHLIAQSVSGDHGHAFRASNQFLFVK